MKRKIKWRTPSAGDGSHGGPNARDSSGALHLTAQVVRSERERERESNAERLTGNPNHHVPTPTSSDGIERKSTNVGASNGELCFETNKSVSLDRWVKRFPTPQASDGTQKKTSKSWKKKGGVNFTLSNPEVMEKYPEDLNLPTADSRQPTADSRQPTASSSEMADSPHSEFVRRKRERRDDRQADGGWDHFQRGAEGDARWWETEPGMGRVVDGLAYRVDRLRLTGNGVVPQQAAVAWQKIKDLAEAAQDVA